MKRLFLMVGLETIALGLVFKLLWSWFLGSMFRAPPITVAQGMGFALFIILMSRKSKKEDGYPLIKDIQEALGLPIFALILGWVIHLFK